jgi:hypothetical protein
MRSSISAHRPITSELAVSCKQRSTVGSNEMRSRKRLTNNDEPDAFGMYEMEPEQKNDSYEELWARNLSIADLLIPIAIVALFVGWDLIRRPVPPMLAEAAIARQAPPLPAPRPVRCDGDPNFDRTC